MARNRRLNIVDVLLLLAVLAVAACTRFWYIAKFASHGQNDGPWHVQEASLHLAPAENDKEKPQSEQQALLQNLRESHWFGAKAPLANGEEKTADLAPGYIWSLYWLERLPLGNASLPQRVRWVQCLLGVLTAGLYFLLALWMFDNRLAAILSGLFCALHPFWIVNACEIQDGVLATFLLAACLVLGTRANQAAGALSSLLFGLALAGLALVRAALLPFTVLALLGFLWRLRNISRGWLCALLAVLAFVNALAPWTFRNYKSFNTLVPVADSAWLHLWIGNNERSRGGPQSDEAIASTLAEERSQDPKLTADELAGLPQTQRYDRLARDVLRQVRRDPAAALNHRLQAAVCFIFGEKWLDSGELWETNPSGADMASSWQHMVAAAFYGSMALMISFGLLGWRWSYAWHRSSILAACAFMFVPFPYILSHAGLLSGPRLPLDGVLLCYSAFALTCFLPGMAPRQFAGPEAGDATP
jgi:4-amino-4-deoxy-L-arabinose transferase-like glycosyltransferase